MRFGRQIRFGAAVCGLLGVGAGARAMEHVTLRNGFAVDCERREIVGERVRLYLSYEDGAAEGNANYLEVAKDAVVRVEGTADAPREKPRVETRVSRTSSGQGLRSAQADNQGQPGSRSAGGEGLPPLRAAEPTAAEMHEMLAHAGVQHRVDADLLASVVRAESGGQVRAVSRTGARGLMQLMPGTAADLGVKDAFMPAQNIDGGSAYLDALLTRYHDDMALALAAYNAGPKAVDRYHGVPPYRETRAYVARVIREFNRRKLAERRAQF